VKLAVMVHPVLTLRSCHCTIWTCALCWLSIAALVASVNQERVGGDGARKLNDGKQAGLVGTLTNRAGMDYNLRSLSRPWARISSCEQ
jgi:hypothetical protein